VVQTRGSKNKDRGGRRKRENGKVLDHCSVSPNGATEETRYRQTTSTKSAKFDSLEERLRGARGELNVGRAKKGKKATELEEFEGKDEKTQIRG